jgi:hypothetical protein
VLDQKPNDARACDLKRALSSAVNPAACMTTVMVTSNHAIRIFKSISKYSEQRNRKYWAMPQRHPRARHFVAQGF